MVTEDDLLVATKAIRDEVRGMLNQAFKSTRSEVTSEVLDQFEKMVGSRMAKMQEAFDSHLKALESKRQEDVKRLEMSYLVGMDNVVKLIKSLPTPQVSYTAPEVKVLAPNVHLEPKFVVPEQKAPTVNVNVPLQEAPTVTVNVPQQEKSIVNVTVPVPEVKVETPKARLTRKHIEHDEYGRAVVITEEEL